MGLRLDQRVGLDQKGTVLGMLSVRHDISVDILSRSHSHTVLERLEDEDVLR